MTFRLLMMASIAAFMPIGLSACQPKVQIVPSDKPIVINLNVKIDQEVRIRLEKDVENLIANNPDLF